MAFNINEIKANLKYGGARNTQFQVVISNPINPVADTVAPFLCRAASIPGSYLGSIDVPYFGRKWPVAGDRTFEPWNVTIINDEDFKVRHALEAWSYAINTHEGNVNVVGGGAAGTGAPGLYQAMAEVKQYSKTGQVVRVYRFTGIWPEQISQINLDWHQVNTIEEFQVRFQYTSYEVVGGTTGTLTESSPFIDL